MAMLLSCRLQRCTCCLFELVFFYTEMLNAQDVVHFDGVNILLISTGHRQDDNTIFTFFKLGSQFP